MAVFVESRTVFYLKYMFFIHFIMDADFRFVIREGETREVTKGKVRFFFSVDLASDKVACMFLATDL